MTQIPDCNIHHDLAAQARLMHLARYRSMQKRLERERCLQLSRRRLLALRHDHPWGWLAL